MSVATREATIACEGALARGSGTPSSGSGALEQLPITWASRTERPDDTTYDRRGSAGCGGRVDGVVGIARADRAEARRERGAAIVVSDLSELLEGP